ncbi:hypothetical protein LCGC14_0863910 [marine sediment metagenome]|uniref:Prohead serine protease domain-containing protein n=1 Tax=marine sediment metagenome TaxID=412755 RepID=A0A0F9PS28_9ZZZZ
MPSGAWKGNEVGGVRRSIRMLSMGPAEIRLDESGEHPRLVGYASVFFDGTAKTEFRLWEDMVERIMPGAFDKTLKAKDDVRALFNHDPSMILGRTTAGTVELETDKRGLKYSIDLGSTTIAEDVVKHIRRGDVSGSSFGFEVTDVEHRMEDKVNIREITGVKLFDVGPVTFPAYEATDVVVRQDEMAEIRSELAEWRAKRTGSRVNSKRAQRMALTNHTQELQSGRKW